MKAKILISYKFHADSLKSLPEGISYMPEIGYEFPGDLKSQQEVLGQQLAKIRPQVLIVGSNLVGSKAIQHWRKAVGEKSALSIIRRGTEIGGIDAEACTKFNVFIQNTPDINSLSVARHLLKRLDLNSGDNLSIIGVGSIGGYIARRAAQKNIRLNLFSPSLSQPVSRKQALARAGLDSYRKLNCAPSIAKALENATKVVVAVPWRAGKGYNQDLIKVSHISKLGRPAVIVSASNPGVFSDTALELMQKRCALDQLSVHIDTGVTYARQYRPRFPLIDIEHDVAFADPATQKQLDQAALAKALDFLASNN